MGALIAGITAVGALVIGGTIACVATGVGVEKLIVIIVLAGFGTWVVGYITGLLDADPFPTSYKRAIAEHQHLLSPNQTSFVSKKFQPNKSGSTD